MYELRSARFLAQEMREKILVPGDTAVDATLGNGYDACDLARLVGPSGHVYGFDIQEKAIHSTRERLTSAGLQDRCTLILSGHEHMREYVSPGVSLIAFNLGWLPGGDKQITTCWETTHAALESALMLLKPGGVCTVCVYPGHDEGSRERDELIRFLSLLRPQQYNVLEQRFLNAGTGAPECLVIQKQLALSSCAGT